MLITINFISIRYKITIFIRSSVFSNQSHFYFKSAFYRLNPIQRCTINYQFTPTMQVNQEIIDLQSDIEMQNNIKVHHKYYFGTFLLELNNSLLKLQFEFKRHLVSTDLNNQELEMIGREEYQLTKPMQLLISWTELTPTIKKYFASLRVFATFLKDEINNPESIQVDREKLTIKLEGKQPTCLYFSIYKRIEKTQLIEDMKKVHDTFSKLTQEDMSLLDPDILLAGSNFQQEDTLKMLLDEGQEDEDTLEQQSNDTKEQQKQSSINSNHKIDNSEADNKTAEIFGSQFKFPDPNHNKFEGVIKQNQIPIYVRYKGFNINISKKQKMKEAEKMLRIGYSKEEIIRFFSGGAEQMQNQDNYLPDYRNPQTARYKQIHLLVAKKQHARHNQLLRRHGLPPIQELPEYAGQIMPKKPQLTDERRIRDMLISLIKQKRFKKLDDIHAEMKRNGVETTLTFLRKIVQQLKQKSKQKKIHLKKPQNGTQPVVIN